MSGRLQCILLTLPDSTVLQVCRARSLILRLTGAPCLTYYVLFLGLHRAGVPGRSFPNRLWPPGRRRDVSRGLVYSRSEKRVGVGGEHRPFLARPSGQRGESESEASAGPPSPGLPVGEAGQSRKRVLFLLGQAFRSETGSPFWPVVRYLGRPRSCTSFTTSFAGPSFC